MITRLFSTSAFLKIDNESKVDDNFRDPTPVAQEDNYDWHLVNANRKVYEYAEKCHRENSEDKVLIESEWGYPIPDFSRKHLTDLSEQFNECSSSLEAQALCDAYANSLNTAQASVDSTFTASYRGGVVSSEAEHKSKRDKYLELTENHEKRYSDAKGELRSEADRSNYPIALKSMYEPYADAVAAHAEEMAGNSPESNDANASGSEQQEEMAGDSAQPEPPKRFKQWTEDVVKTDYDSWEPCDD